jgi:hypothetical protein
MIESSGPETGPHSRVDTIRQERPESSRWAWWFGVVCAVVFVAVAAVGSVVVVRGVDTPAGSTLTSSRATPSVSPTPRETLEAEKVIPPSAAPEPVPASCWEARPIAEDKECQILVRDRTKFVPRYMTNQTALAKAHPIVKLANTGRNANSLARHGLLVCWMINEPDWTLDDIQSAFFLWFHRHPYTVPNNDHDAAANNVLSMAVQEICPSDAEKFEDKGGPKAELTEG